MPGFIGAPLSLPPYHAAAPTTEVAGADVTRHSQVVAGASWSGRLPSASGGRDAPVLHHLGTWRTFWGSGPFTAPGVEATPGYAQPPDRGFGVPGSIVGAPKAVAIDHTLATYLEIAAGTSDPVFASVGALLRAAGVFYGRFLGTQFGLGEGHFLLNAVPVATLGPAPRAPFGTTTYRLRFVDAAAILGGDVLVLSVLSGHYQARDAVFWHPDVEAIDSDLAELGKAYPKFRRYKQVFYQDRVDLGGPSPERLPNQDAVAARVTAGGAPYQVSGRGPYSTPGVRENYTADVVTDIRNFFSI